MPSKLLGLLAAVVQKGAPASLQPWAASYFNEDAIGFSLVVSIIIVLLTYVFLFKILPGLRMDYYLSKFPTMTGKLPVLGHALRLTGAAPWGKMMRWSFRPELNAAKGKGGNRVVYFNVVGMRVLYINEPKLLRRVLLTHQRNYRKAIDSAYKHFMCLLGTGLVTSEDEQWKKGRLLLSHALRIDILEDIPLMTMNAVDRIMQKLDAVGGKASFVDLNEEFRHMTLQVIGESSLSLTPEETDRIFPALYLPIVHECNKRVWAPWREFMPFLKAPRAHTCLVALNKVLGDIIVSRWKTKDAAMASGKPDILALCMSQISAIDDHVVQELRDDVKTMLLAGHETSAALLTWASYELVRRPEARAKVVEEAKRLFDPKNCKETIETRYGKRGVPTADQVRQLVYTPAVLRETLRLHSVVPLVMRYAAKDDVWPASESGLDRDLKVPAGCTVAVGIAGVHHNENVWEDPEKFDPERFVDADIANNTNTLNSKVKHEYAKTIDPYAFIPFINGPRNCLGQHLSIMETQVALAYLFLNWDLKLYRNPRTPETPNWEEEVGRHHDFIIPQVPHDGLKVFGSVNKI
ncbi:cytochrome p450-like protein [Strigomonas culicis]|uniref:Cytochrome p450-like protein n=1 Tax=Strigomonas culicis TaxID=28005 RepID=S9VDH6_9TRYP|nr:cytochrome p450-like protein [Strigomonas culicis]|eukprot:EPY25061.1 cytochrome p450-like protein [Strigomonas culicis]